MRFLSGGESPCCTTCSASDDIDSEQKISEPQLYCSGELERIAFIIRQNTPRVSEALTLHTHPHTHILSANLAARSTASRMDMDSSLVSREPMNNRAQASARSSRISSAQRTAARSKAPKRQWPKRQSKRQWPKRQSAKAIKRQAPKRQSAHTARRIDQNTAYATDNQCKRSQPASPFTSCAAA